MWNGRNLAVVKSEQGPDGLEQHLAMSRARTKLWILLLAIVPVACRNRAHIAQPILPSLPTSASCAPRDTLSVTIAVTDELDTRTIDDFLVRAPFGPCANVTRRYIRTADARDVLDTGVGMLITSSPTVLTYANARADLTSTPLAWDVTYALMAADSVSMPLSISRATLDSLRTELAHDVVRVEARAASASPCGESRAQRAGTVRFIGYDEHDTIGASIAARLAALAGDSVRAAPHRGEALRHLPAALVVPFRIWDNQMCGLTSYVVPLIETRARAITRRRPQ